MKIGLIISLLLIEILSEKYIVLTEEQFKQLINMTKEQEIINKVDDKENKRRVEELINSLKNEEEKKKKQEIETESKQKEQEQKRLETYFKQLSLIKQTGSNQVEVKNQVKEKYPEYFPQIIKPIQINHTVNTSHTSQMFPTTKPKLQPISLTLIPIQTNGDPVFKPINIKEKQYFYQKNNINRALETMPRVYPCINNVVTTQPNIDERINQDQIRKIDGKGNLINGVINYENDNKILNNIGSQQNQDMFRGLFDSSSFWSDIKTIPSSLSTQNYYSNLLIRTQAPKLPSLPSLPPLPNLPSLPSLPNLPTRLRLTNNIRLTQMQSPVSRYSITDDIKWRI